MDPDLIPSTNIYLSPYSIPSFLSRTAQQTKDLVPGGLTLGEMLDKQIRKHTMRSVFQLTACGTLLELTPAVFKDQGGAGVA